MTTPRPSQGPDPRWTDRAPRSGSAAWLSVAGLALSPLLLLLLVGLAAEPAQAQLKMEVRDDGVKVISNESRTHRVRRTSSRMVAVPDPDLDRMIVHHSARTRLDPRLVRAVIQAESGYNAAAVSEKGAMGLMQLMPATAGDLRVDDPFDPEQNVRGGTTYLARLMDRFRRLELALAAYNAGPTTVERYGGVPPYRETRNYVRRVIRLYKGADAAVDLEVPAKPVQKPARKPILVRRPGERILLTTEAPD